MENNKWYYWKCKYGSQQSTFKTDNGKKVTEPDEIHNSFNDFFVNIGHKLASGIKHTGKIFLIIF